MWKKDLIVEVTTDVKEKVNSGVMHVPPGAAEKNVCSDNHRISINVRGEEKASNLDKLSLLLSQKSPPYGRMYYEKWRGSTVIR